jgi:hypothetical protein
MTECACSYDIDANDGDYAEECTVYDAIVLHTCRKAKCIECGLVLEVGDIVERIDQKFEDEWSHFFTCPDCISVRKNLFCAFMYGCIWDDLRNEIIDEGNMPSESCMALLTPKAREDVCELIEESYGDDDE